MVRAAAISRFLFMFVVPVQSMLALAPSLVSSLGICRACAYNASRSRSVYLELKLVARTVSVDLEYCQFVTIDVTLRHDHHSWLSASPRFRKMAQYDEGQLHLSEPMLSVPSLLHAPN